MKKIILPILLMPFLFYSCKKESKQVTPINTSKKYQVQFGVSGFQQIILNTTKARHQENSIKNVFGATGNELTLDYLVYDSNGNLVHTITQPADSGKTTTVKDSLPAGTYTFCFAIGGAARLILPRYKEITYPDPSTGETGPDWRDTFVKQLTLTVGSGNVNQNVTLDRLVAELEADITGPIPANATKFTIKVDKEYIYGKFSGQPDTTRGPSGIKSRYVFFPMTQTTTKFSLILLNTASPVNVELTAYDASGSILAKATVNNVTCAVNTRTILTGALFGSQTSTFTVSLNNQWATDPYTTINF
jgi:hypothetical protein